LLLQVDLRAHQVFVGFPDLEPIRAAFRHIAPAFVPCWIEARGETQAADLHAIERWPKGATLVVPALNHEHAGGLYGLVWVVDRLLGPGGCPWDQAQTHESLKRHLIEESYELFDAIDDHDDERMREELGDVLLQPLMHTQIRKAAGGWDIDAAAREITDKLIRRHPHVFGDVDVADADEVLRNWDAIKKTEKSEPRSVLAGVPTGMPSLLRAFEISKRAVRCGFEWPDIEAVWDKVDEETLELKEALATGDTKAIESEVGDLLFTVVNIARWAKVEPEEALRQMLNRFSARFMAMEAASPKPLAELSPQEWDDLWQKAKAMTGP
jgi:tetrapyrrole methylase family protein/MazG family protein